MKILLINSVCGIGSTGKIVSKIANNYLDNGNECVVAYGRYNAPKECAAYSKKICTSLEVKINGVKARILDNEGFNAKKSTKRFLDWVEKYNPDVIWIHNLHGYYINIELLFNWLKKHENINVKWTLHDCWAFTGHCAYFSYVNCNKWTEGCSKCIQKYKYPKSIFFDNSSKNYEMKKKMFSGIKNMELIVPSKWLEKLVKNSFLGVYKISIVKNSIDKNIYKVSNKNYFDKFNINNKIILLGLANVWEERKGLYDFYKLSQMLNNNYVIVLVGLEKKQINKIEKKISNVKMVSSINGISVFEKITEQENNNDSINKDDSQVFIKVNPSVENVYRLLMKKEPIYNNKFSINKLICIERTNNQIELANIYSSADYYLHLSYEDNYPTTCLEAKACGTSIILYDCCGNSETIDD